MPRPSEASQNVISHRSDIQRAQTTAIRQSLAVAGQRTVILDPDGTGPDWSYVVIEWPTGVIYQQQYGGTATRQGEVEGYLVPVDASEARPILDGVFVKRLRRVGTWGNRLEPELLSEIRRAVGLIRFWPDGQGTPSVEPLQVDELRLDDLDEAWVPVRTSDGAGLLLWANSD